MLGSVFIGSVDGNPQDNWSVIKDDYDNVYLSSDIIKQRIRIGKNVKPLCNEDSTQVLQFSDNGGEIASATFDISGSTIISNNNKNMTLTLMNYWNPDSKKLAAHYDDSIVYVTLDATQYRLLSYSLELEGIKVINTFRRRDSNSPKGKNFDKYFGCAIIIPGNIIKEMKSRTTVDNTVISKTIMSLVVKDMKAVNETKRISVDLIYDENSPERGYIPLYINSYKEDVSAEEEREIRQKNKKYARFDISVPLGTLLTNTYITSPAKEQLTREIVRNVPNAEVIVLDEPFSLKNKKQRKLFDEKITNNRIRAVTTHGVTLEKDFIKAYKQLYVFEIAAVDKDTFTLIAVKTN